MLNNFLKERSSDQSGFLQGTINLVIKHFLHKLKEKIDRNTFKKVKLYCILLKFVFKKNIRSRSRLDRLHNTAQ